MPCILAAQQRSHSNMFPSIKPVPIIRRLCFYSDIDYKIFINPFASIPRFLRKIFTINSVQSVIVTCSG